MGMWRCVKNGKTNDPGFNASGRQASFLAGRRHTSQKIKYHKPPSLWPSKAPQYINFKSWSKLDGTQHLSIDYYFNAGKVGKYQTRLCCQPVPSSQFQLSLSSFSQVILFHAWSYCGTTSPLLSRDFYIGFKAFRMSDYVFMAGLHNICFPCLFGGLGNGREEIF